MLKPEQKQGTVIAIDYGLKRMGLACGDLSLQIAHPLMTITESNREKKIQILKDLIPTWNPVLWVMGIPFHPDGTDNDFTKPCLNFAQSLTRKTQLPVYLVDERYSSCYAEDLLNDNLISGHKKKQFLDQVAAQAILSSFFNDGSYQYLTC
ncbi:Holliday junction resolvase RuvX [Neisseriaceae bacterium PsAf]|nr:Holliday junction resolvase RuvX [Neisseriaceae bacterium PsAf]